MESQRLADLQAFYSIIARLENGLGGMRTLGDCSGRLNWPKRGVYFFMEKSEVRSSSGNGLRIVRVGTHALKSASQTRLWTRLSQHRGGRRTGGGNHRGSIFRLIVGAALIARHGYEFPTWGSGQSASADVRVGEVDLEREVTSLIGAMPFVWVRVDDEPSAGSMRGYIERNTIALLSNFGKTPIDAPSVGWLGHDCNRERVKKSGLWNSNHVDETYDPAFLECLEMHVLAMEKAV